MKRVAFLSFDWDYKIISEYYLGLQDHIAGKEAQMFIFNAFGRYYSSLRPKESSFRVLSLCDLAAFDGVLIQGNRSWPPEQRQKVVDRAIALGKPVVSINYDLPGAHAVGTNNYQEEYELVDRVLTDRACKRPAFVNGLKTSAEAQARLRGYLDACARHGIKNPQVYQANWQFEAGVATARKMLRRPNDLPDVVFCCNDDLAAGMQQTLQAEGLRIPDDVMVAGFDNRQLEIAVDPPITTIDRDYRTIAATALDTILKLIDGEELPTKVYSPARHILTPSCGYEADAEAASQGAQPASDEVQGCFFDALGDFQLAAMDAGSLYVVLECFERFASALGCPNVFVSLNDAYLHATKQRDASEYGPISHLMARKGSDLKMPCDSEHVYTNFATNEILPPEVPSDRPLYLVSPLRHGEACIGMVVTEGIPVGASRGFLSLVLSMLSGAIEIVRKTEP